MRSVSIRSAHSAHETRRRLQRSFGFTLLSRYVGVLFEHAFIVYEGRMRSFFSPMFRGRVRIGQDGTSVVTGAFWPAPMGIAGEVAMLYFSLRMVTRPGACALLLAVFAVEALYRYATMSARATRIREMMEDALRPPP